MNISKLLLPNVFLFELNKNIDDRGFFIEIFRKINFDFNVVQVNHSFSRKGVIRGFHFQKPPKEQAKFIKVISGRILDVVVNLDSLKYLMIELDENKALFIPKGYAHGFLALEDTHLIYFTDEYYDPEYEAGIIYNDKTLNIPWPIENPILSDKDKNLPPLQVL